MVIGRFLQNSDTFGALIALGLLGWALRRTAGGDAPDGGAAPAIATADGTTTGRDRLPGRDRHRSPGPHRRGVRALLRRSADPGDALGLDVGGPALLDAREPPHREGHHPGERRTARRSRSRRG